MMSKKILIVDDEKNILKSLSGPLSREGYDVATAASFADAVGENDGSFDVVLLDVWLPDGDGVKLLRQFKRDFSDQQVVMMSGHSTIETAVEAVKSGAYDFLEKPLSLERVLVTIENALHFKDLTRENIELRRAVDRKYELVGESDEIAQVREKIGLAAKSNARVIIRGESGTGKEIVARRIHLLGERSSEPFVPVNCAAVPDELMESELFGHRKGAFTGATADRKGKFEEADSGSLFLDEIGDMNLRAQAKLLRVIEAGVVERLGGGSREVDVRVIAATNKNLEVMIEREKFREDLFFRLNVFPIQLPPLRRRKEDIPLLTEHFMTTLCAEYGRKQVELSKGAANLLTKLEFPGNVRELKNLVERMLITNNFSDIASEDVVEASAGRSPLRGATKPLKIAVEEFERSYIERAIKDADGNMAEAARRLQLERSHLYKKLKALGLER